MPVTWWLPTWFGEVLCDDWGSFGSARVVAWVGEAGGGFEQDLELEDQLLSLGGEL